MLAQKLRDMHALAADSCDPAYNRMLLEAADEIARLTARAEAAERERDEARAEITEVDRLLAAERRAEIERLRAALSEIAENSYEESAIYARQILAGELEPRGYEQKVTEEGR